MTKQNFRYADDTSIVIITHNRPAFVRRFAGSLELLDFGGHLIIAESSDDNNYSTSKKYLSELSLNYEVKHIHTSKSDSQTVSHSMNESFKAGISEISTEYAMMSCDDDIPIPLTLHIFQQFLKENKSYNGANGDYVWFDIDCIQSEPKNTKPGILKNLFSFIDNTNTSGRRKGINGSFELEGETAGERLNNYVNDIFHTMFTVVRSNTLTSIIPSNFDQIAFPHFSADYNWMISIALHGKIRHFSQPQIIRQFHGKNLSIKDENHPFPSYLDGMLSENWGSDSTKFINNIANTICEIDKMDYNNAHKYAIDAYRKITIQRLSGKFRHENKINIQLKQILKKIYLLKYRIIFFKNYKIYSNAVSTISKYPL